MITEQERNEIVNEAVEKVLKMIPEVMGNLMANHAALHKINKAFYDKHPEFSQRRDIVQSVVEMIEGKNPLLEYSEILEKAVPEIEQRIKIAKNIDVATPITTMPRDFSKVDITPNGVL